MTSHYNKPKGLKVAREDQKADRHDNYIFSTGELINTLWPFKFKSTTLLKDIENFHNVRLQERLQIVWKQKHKSEHGTWDKKILTPPPIKICPLFDEPKKGDFFYPPPSHMDQCLLLSNFFFEGIPYHKLWLYLKSWWLGLGTILVLLENLHFTKPSQKSNIVPNLHFTKPSLNKTLWVKLTLKIL